MTILQYCSVCKTEYDMAVVPTADGDDDGVVWLQCPNCKGYLPKVSSSLALRGGVRAPAEPADEADAVAPVAPDLFTAEDDDEDEPSHAAPSPESTATATPDGDDDADLVADLDFEQAVPYRPWQTYAVGDVIHHLAWDDFGLVLGKEVLPGNRRVVKVRFTTAGTVHLIEQDGVGP